VAAAGAMLKVNTPAAITLRNNMFISVSTPICRVTNRGIFRSQGNRTAISWTRRRMTAMAKLRLKKVDAQ
jgi:hypothetical protein